MRRMAFRSGILKVDTTNLTFEEEWMARFGADQLDIVLASVTAVC